jgi:hypothetical protein
MFSDAVPILTLGCFLYFAIGAVVLTVHGDSPFDMFRAR